MKHKTRKRKGGANFEWNLFNTKRLTQDQSREKFLRQKKKDDEKERVRKAKEAAEEALLDKKDKVKAQATAIEEDLKRAFTKYDEIQLTVPEGVITPSEGQKQVHDLTGFAVRALINCIAVHNNTLKATDPFRGKFNANPFYCGGQCIERAKNIRKALRDLLYISEHSNALGYIGTIDAGIKTVGFAANSVSGLVNKWGYGNKAPSIPNNSSLLQVSTPSTTNPIHGQGPTDAPPYTPSSTDASNPPPLPPRPSAQGQSATNPSKQSSQWTQFKDVTGDWFFNPITRERLNTLQPGTKFYIYNPAEPSVVHGTPTNTA